MSEQDLLDQIDEKHEERRRLFGKPVRAQQLDEEIADLYEQLRTVRATRAHGVRTVIVKRARIERELEKLNL